MDKTLINLLSILIGGAGLFAVLTRYGVPELDATFLGHNPFVLKRDSIADVMSWMFTSLAVLGLLLQAFRVIFENSLSEPVRQPHFYIVAFLVGILVMVMLVMAISFTGKRIAKRVWLPKVIENQRESFCSSAFIVEHNGWREDQLPVKENQPQAELYRQKNYESAEERFAQIERLLELQRPSDDLNERMKRLRPYFAAAPNK
jgi:hypothetical protein